MKLSLLTRMTAPLVIVSVLLLFLGVVTAWYVHRLQHNASETLASNVSSIRAAEELEIGLREIRTGLNQFVITNDPAQLTRMAKLRTETDRWLLECDRLATTPREQQLMSAVKRGYTRFFDQLDSHLMIGVQESISKTDLRDLIENVLTDEILQPAHEYLDFNESIIAANSERGQALANRMVLGLLLLGTCGPMAGLLAGFAIARKISRSLLQLSVPVRDAAGKLNEVVGPIEVSTGRDIEDIEATLHVLTHRVVTVVEQLQQSQREVLRSEQLAAVGQLAAGVAHELRNPLQSMQLLVQAAIEEGEGGCLEGRDLAVLRESIARLNRSVKTFLDFARPPALERRLVHLEDILRETVELVEPQAHRQGVQLLWQPPPTALPLLADPDQLRQLLLNLVLNALDAGPRVVTLALSLAEEFGDSSVRLIVSDDGCGLPKGLGERIFEPFVTSKEAGVGLGLTICKRIVESHGGTIQGANQTSGGAQFVIELPLAGDQPCRKS